MVTATDWRWPRAWILMSSNSHEKQRLKIQFNVINISIIRKSFIQKIKAFVKALFRIILLIWIRIFVLTVRGSNHDCVQDPSPYPVFGFDWATNPDLCLPLTTVCPRSSDQFYVVNYYINGSLLLGYIVWWRSRIRFPSRVGYGSQPGLQIRVGFIRFRLREKRIRIRSSKKNGCGPGFFSGSDQISKTGSGSDQIINQTTLSTPNLDIVATIYTKKI